MELHFHRLTRWIPQFTIYPWSIDFKYFSKSESLLISFEDCKQSWSELLRYKFACVKKSIVGLRISDVRKLIENCDFIDFYAGKVQRENEKWVELAVAIGQVQFFPFYKTENGEKRKCHFFISFSLVTSHSSQMNKTSIFYCVSLIQVYPMHADISNKTISIHERI